MNINPQLVEWLRLEMSGSNPLELTHRHANTYVMLLRECCDAKLIELAHIDNGKIAIRYRLTTIGEYWSDPANDPATSTPVSDSGATGDMENVATLQLKLAQALYSLDDTKTQLAAANCELSEKGREVDTMQDSIDDLNHMVDLARAERNSVKVQLAECQHAHELARTQRDAATELYSGKHGRIEELKRELEVSRDARKALEKIIQSACNAINGDGTPVAILGKVYELLEPYSNPRSDNPVLM